MPKLLGLLSVSVLLLTACNELIRPTRYELPPIQVSGTTYEVFMLARGENPNYSDPREDPEGVTSVYVVIGPGSVIYCGSNASQCEALVRRFNAGESVLREGM